MRDEERIVLPINRPKKQKRSGGFMTLLLLAAIAVLCVAIFKSMTGDDTSDPMVIDQYGGITAVTTAAPAANLVLRPVSEGPDLLPVFYEAGTEEKKLAFTVQHITDKEDLETILGQAGTYGVKLTFFVTGTELNRYSELWSDAILGGHEIESMGFTGAKLASLSDEELKVEIDMFTFAARSLIGEGYQPHFLRTDTLSDDTDVRLHRYLASQGYYGISRWKAFNPTAVSQLAPGAILAVDLTSYGTDATGKLMKALEENGFAAVTMNSLFEYGDNLPQGVE